MPSNVKVISNYVFRISSNFLLWIFAALITVGLPWWVFNDSDSRAASVTAKISELIEWKLWFTLIAAAIFAAALMFFVSREDEAKSRHQFGKFLIEDVFGILLNAGSLLAVCSLWLLNPFLSLIAAVSYLIGLRFWYFLLPRP
ncbi:hypothetical protein [Xanthomonas campestris]|uniref:hypothetical protein n=1 Tax=Xanthomonas campestris TaxID=339 RepID=UPI0011C4189D|nr:hypothetical protein [Xanthomonas campestris]MCC8688789.1 hypothetical protein [Xanthomonas campestris]MDM7696063.1 hypothetical protein [Xanthomonas campestris pv. campestris]